MKITLVYLHVVGKSDPNAPDPSYYTAFHQRFAATYRQHKPDLQHSLVVCFCGGIEDEEAERGYMDFNPIFARYSGGGWDIGAHQHIATMLDATTTDLAVFLATPVYFWRADWLQKIVDAFEQYGDGLYGPMASFEHAPHIRTSCFACSPATFRKYPHIIDTREKGRYFESTDWNFSRWFESGGQPVKMVTADGCYDREDWRKPDNIFRRGDQSNTLIRDRHVDLWNLSSPEEKKKLSDAADGK